MTDDGNEFDAFERTLHWLYDQCRHRAETEASWQFTAGLVAQAIGHFRVWRVYCDHGRDDRADEAGDRVDDWLKQAGDEMRGLRRDAALAETADLLRRDLEGFRLAAGGNPTP